MMGRRVAAALVPLFCCFALVCCDAVSDLNKVVDEFWAWRLVDEPEFATSVGVYDNNDKLRSYDYGQFEVRKNKCQELLNKLNGVVESQLDSSQKITYGVLKDSLEGFIDAYQWRNYGSLTPINFLEGVHSDVKSVVSNTPFKSKSDYTKLITRLRALPLLLSQQMALMRRAISEGTTNHNVSMLQVPPQINSVFNGSVEEMALYKPFKGALTNLTGIGDSDKQNLRNEGKTVISTLVVPAFLNFSRFIEDEYIPNCRQSYGVLGLKNGLDYYKACLKWHLSTDMTPDEVHNKGLEEVARLKAEMLRIAKKTGFTGSTLVEFFESLKTDKRFYRNTSQELLDLYNDIIFKRIKPQLKKVFDDITEYPLEVKPMEFDGPGGAYSSGTEDGSRPGIFWVNLRNPEKRATFDMTALSLHEADPGHHMQISYQIREKTIPAFRKYQDYSKYFNCPFHFPFFTAYTEGWALYAEDVGIEMGSYVDDYELFGKYSSEMFRACRLVVDTGLHAKGWSRERAVNYMVEHTFDLKSQLEIEVDRYITWPGQACAYKIGQLKIQELRKKAKTQLGDSFKVADFHDVVLRVGAVPLKLLEQRVADWIQEKKTSSAAINLPVIWTVCIALCKAFIFV